MTFTMRHLVLVLAMWLKILAMHIIIGLTLGWSPGSALGDNPLGRFPGSPRESTLEETSGSINRVTPKVNPGDNLGVNPQGRPEGHP